MESKIKELQAKARQVEEQLAEQRHEFQRQNEQEQSVNNFLRQQFNRVADRAQAQGDRQLLANLSSVQQDVIQRQQQYLTQLSDQQQQKQHEFNAQLDDLQATIQTQR
ncbi:hypothetical protein [Bombilactobacillus thymidiniphilus]|uniref:Uncharacterized protein n=1 Tax=Bombilactobacillus thymidiniphilus TaxID=2923363 RepID=A0ABY4PBE9_9LACO|nr:hypothetical protein [Bombilactobacillus thymidiniphilus]UQS83006.1 hypothetical protein MOO47_04280 [Bombilactobacillus thymidiniphilus]